jgi:hypothetical protein
LRLRAARCCFALVRGSHVAERLFTLAGVTHAMPFIDASQIDGHCAQPRERANESDCDR